jgi:para-nitrobenzyl esterase
LYLNVWAKHDEQKDKPVVYLHSGAFASGGASTDYNGEYLATQDVVFVSINYRLGIYGFLATDELSAESPTGISGNYGLMDMIQALEWVQANIEQFGGDPTNVTLMGQSAGSLQLYGVIS